MSKFVPGLLLGVVLGIILALTSSACPQELTQQEICRLVRSFYNQLTPDEIASYRAQATPEQIAAVQACLRPARRVRPRPKGEF